jgi:hypothetical protein
MVTILCTSINMRYPLLVVLAPTSMSAGRRMMANQQTNDRNWVGHHLLRCEGPWPDGF